MCVIELLLRSYNEVPTLPPLSSYCLWDRRNTHMRTASLLTHDPENKSGSVRGTVATAHGGEPITKSL